MITRLNLIKESYTKKGYVSTEVDLGLLIKDLPPRTQISFSLFCLFL